MNNNMESKPKWNSVILLFTSQALFQTASIMVMTLSGMVGLDLATDKNLATLPIAMISVGTATMMIPASLLIKKLGQKKTFLIGTILGMMAGFLSFYGILHRSFAIFVIGNMLVGCYQGFAQYYRFAAADTVPEAAKAKALSFVVAGGVVAAIAGPNLARYTQHIGEVPFAYSYLSITLLSIGAFFIIFNLKLRKATIQTVEDIAEKSRPLLEILRQKDTLTAIVSSAIGYSVMIMIMTATPLAMHHCGHSSDDAATVIQWHVLGMFVPSFFTGTLINKFGVRRLMFVGVIILFLHVTFALTGTDFFNFVSGLILLGVGWNFMFIGGSTLLTKVYTLAEKEKTQAFHDFFVFAVISISSFSAGSILNLWGWRGVNLATIPLLLFALIIMISLKKIKE